jgi:hypothetical protein
MKTYLKTFEQREAEAIREGYKAEVCSGCDTVIFAHHHFIRCEKETCPMKDGEGSILEQLLKEPHVKSHAPQPETPPGVANVIQATSITGYDVK